MIWMAYSTDIRFPILNASADNFQSFIYQFSEYRPLFLSAMQSYPPSLYEETTHHIFGITFLPLSVSNLRV